MATITCDDPELHVSNGSVSSMPGSSHALPKGAMCDCHPKVPAVARIQGETDSFGCEYNLMCQACLDEHRIAVREAFNAESRCDYCKTMQRHCSSMRDYDEGMGGPVYNVCPACRKRVNDRIAEELERYDGEFDFDDAYYGDEDDYAGDPFVEEDDHHDDAFYASEEDETLYRSSQTAPKILNGGAILPSMKDGNNA